MSTFYPENIPLALRERNQWLVWKLELRGGKKTKVPYDAKTGAKAQWKDPATWATFAEALEGLKKYPKMQGIGYLFTANDPFVGVDLDDCFGADGKLLEQQQVVVDTLDTYTERSQSGNGVHAVAVGKLPDKHRRNGSIPGLEMYDSARFFAVTGDRIAGTPTTIEDRAAQVLAIHAQVFAEKLRKDDQQRAKASARRLAASLDLDDAALIEKARRAQNGPLFSSLFDQGDVSRYGGDDSAADLALCNLLAFWCQKDAGRMDRLFRQSALMREKWERDDYRERTIAEAIATCAEVYTPGHGGGDDRNRNHTGLNGSRAAAAGSVSSAPAPPPAAPGADAVLIHNTDLGNSIRMIRWFGAGLRYSRSHGWLHFDGKRWVAGGEGENAAVETAKRTVRQMYVAAADLGDRERGELVEWALKSESAMRIHAMVGLARTDKTIAIKPDQLDADPWLLNCSNGTIDLRTGTRRDHSREDYCTKLTPIKFDPAATCPTFERFLLEIMDNRQELVDYLQRAVGYTLTGLVTEQVLLFLHGMGANGKSTLMQVLLALLGEYGASAAPGLLIESYGDRHPTERADLAGRRLVVSVAVGEGKKLAEELVKQLTGGDKIKGRWMRQDFFEFEPTHKLWLAANHKPTIRGTDWAIWRRIPLVPFDVTFTDDPKDGQPNKDPLLLGKLLAELPGILAWAVRGCLLWQQQGLNPPAVVTEATKAYRAEQDVLAAFIEDCCLVGDKYQAKSKELYAAYVEWCDQMGERAVKGKDFGSSLRERGFTPARIGHFQHRGWAGIVLKEDRDDGDGMQTDRNGKRGADRACTQTDTRMQTDADTNLDIAELSPAHEPRTEKSCLHLSAPPDLCLEGPEHLSASDVDLSALPPPEREYRF